MKKLLLLIGLLPTLALAASQADFAALKKQLNRVMPPGVHIDSIKPMKNKDLYEVLVGSNVLYISRDGRYMFNGDVIDLKTDENLTETRRNGLRKKLIASVSEKDMIIFGPKTAKHTVTVFTDIDCGYCRKLHSEMDKYIQMGFRVRYLSYPRAGIGSASYQKAVAVWCAEDRNKALTLAKRGDTPQNKTCDNPVAKEYQLGEKIGVRGTPTIILEDGRMIPGYVPAGRLLQIENRQS